MERGISLLGLFVFVGISYLCSVNRQAVRWHPVLWGIGLQFILAVLILKTKPGFAVFEFLGKAVSQFLNFSDQGAKFVFGEAFQDHFIAFKVLPTIIFFSSFISILYHYKILQKVVEAVAWVMVRTLKTSGSETLSCSANIFIGQTEAPLLIKPYISTLTNSELHAVMTGGFATIAGGVMAAYISFGIPAEHILAASVMSAPAALAISKLFYPETEISLTKGKVKIEVQPTSANGIDAAATGASEGMKLALNVAAMLIAFLGLLALINGILQGLGSVFGMPSLSLEGILGYLFAPIAWLMGIPMADCLQVGSLLGKKIVLNEFIAYLDLKKLIENSQQLAQGKGVENTVSTISERAIIISTYALCGFANIGSVAIQIGGISAIAPERQADVARLGIRAMIAGSIACFMTACIAGILL